MRITHSERISELLTGLARRKQLKLARKHAVFSTSANTAIAEEFAKVLCAEFGDGDFPDLVRGVAEASNTSFYFVDGADIVATLENIKPDKKGKTAPKVLVRMLYRRLLALEDAIQRFNVVANSDGGEWAAKYTVPKLAKEHMESARAFACATPSLFESAEDLVAVATREDVTDEIRGWAWGLIETYRVMGT